MAWQDWFRKGNSKADPDVSPGGSKYIRHGGAKQQIPGFSQFSTLPYIEKREAIYQQMFGPCAYVAEDTFPGLVPHIDVYLHKPGHNGRPFYTLVTGGMSDMPMKTTEDVPPDVPRRTEIIFYLPPDEEPSPEYANFLRTYARFVYDFETLLSWGHTIPNGDPPQPLFAGTNFVSVLFLFPLFDPDAKLSEYLVLDGDPVHFLWIVPLTQTEHRYKLEKGTNGLCDRFNRVKLPFVFHRNRASCV
jgi:hypothetical protein